MNTAFSPSLEIAVIEIYIIIVKNCITPKMIQAILSIYFHNLSPYKVFFIAVATS